MSNRKLSPSYALTLALPGGRSIRRPIRAIAQAASMIREFASDRGVSVLAVDWSVAKVER